MPAPAHVQAATINKLIQGWKDWTPDAFLSVWADNCTQTQLPFSGKVPTRTREHVEHFFPILMSLLTNFELKIHNIVHDPAQGKAVIYAMTKADSPFGPYQNEHSLFVWFDESGEKVQKIEEMFDNVVMNEFLPKIQAYVAEQRNGSKEVAAAA